jgi:hypothetical protein
MGSRRLTEESGRASVASWARIRDLQVFSVSERPKMKPQTGDCRGRPETGLNLPG